MTSFPTHDVLVTFESRRLPEPPEGVLQISCRNCGTALNFHQPLPSSPDELLGTCDECGAWHLVEVIPEASTVLVALLPIGHHVTQAVSSLAC